MTSKSGYKYPKDEIDPLWEKVLLCQFHDVLPGSALGMVYEDAEELYAEVHEKGTALLQTAIKALVPSSSVVASASSNAPFAINTSGQPRTELVKVKGKPSSDLLSQSTTSTADMVVLRDLTGAGIATAIEDSELDYVPAQCMRAKDGTFVLSNESLEVKISSKGRITSVYDLREECAIAFGLHIA